MPESNVFDYIICGGGSAGCVLANRLSADPDANVLLLEAGGSDWNPLFHWPAGFARMTKGIASWGWSTVPQRHMKDRALWYTQARVIGGGSTINAQIYTRGHALDYDGWAAEGCAGWSYRDVLPYFRRAEANERFVDEFHADDGPLGIAMPRGALPVCDAFIRAGQQYGLPYNGDFNGDSQFGVGYYQLNQRNARRSSTVSAYLEPARARPNLTVWLNSQVTRIQIEQGRATGVEIRAAGNTGSNLVRAEHEVLIASGAIGSPRLLMLSGIGPADHLQSVDIPPVHDLPGVGCNLQDHIDLSVIAECSGDFSYDRVKQPHRTAWAGLQYLLFRSGPVSSSLFETGGFAFADPDVRSPDIQFHLGLGSGIEKGIGTLKNPGITLNSANLRPRSRGTVRLASPDPLHAPLIDPNFWNDPHDLEISLRGLEMAREILRQDALRPYLKAEALPGNDVQGRAALFDYACKVAKTDHHPVGTCKMGVDAMSVVSPDLRVCGLDGLRVCDSSVMPNIISSNTNAAAIMIAEKAADLVAGREP